MPNGLNGLSPGIQGCEGAGPGDIGVATAGGIMGASGIMGEPGSGIPGGIGCPSMGFGIGFGSVGIGGRTAGSGIGGASGTGDGGAVAVDSLEAAGPAGPVARGVHRWSWAGLSVYTLPPDGESHRYSVAAAGATDKAKSKSKR
jgi:hypothetical protein